MAIETAHNGELRWRVDSLERRADKAETRIENVEAEADAIAVINVKIALLSERVRVMTTALWSCAGLILVAIISDLLLRIQ